MKMLPLLGIGVLSALSWSLPTAVLADEKPHLIELARSAAPSMVSANATVIYQGETLAEGTNGWVCMPETLPGDHSPHCSDGVWMALFKAVGEKAPFNSDSIGVSYMLGGDQGVSNSDPYHPDHGSAGDFIKEGSHLMIIVPKNLLAGMTDDPHKGGPYVMWKDTPYAHIMVPVGERD